MQHTYPQSLILWDSTVTQTIIQPNIRKEQFSPKTSSFRGFLYIPIIMLLLFVIGAAGVGGYIYIKMKGVKPASRKNQPGPDADYSSEIRSAVLLVHGEKAHSRYFSETAYSKLTEDNKEFRDFLAELQANPPQAEPRSVLFRERSSRG